jgi:hypothetical protein
MNGIKSLESKARAKDEEHRRRVDNEIQLRKAQELDRSKGENVWFSRRIQNGHLHHWALFTYGKKYELRLPSRDKFKDMLPNGQFVGSVVPSLQYEAKISQWTLKDEMMRLRDESLVEGGKPYAQDYYICQIGWTKLSEKDVDAACEATRATFGVYVLGFNDCQTFLKQFAKRIINIPDDCALDYQWFATNVETQYHELQLIPPDENLKAYQFYLHTAILGATGATAGAAYLAIDSDSRNSYQSQQPMTTDQKSGDEKGTTDDHGDGDCDCSCCGGCNC